SERRRRRELVAEFERRLIASPAGEWVARFRAAGVPAAEVRQLQQLFEHEQARANGLVQSVAHERFGEVKLLGSLFKIDGAFVHGRSAVPGLGEHNEEVLAQWRPTRS
ncbi:MAG: CoA transferase, partial [Solirubrobacteraceae bacterium]